ncbi:MAG: glycosyltransferase family 4 protein [Bacteroidaceae bacterium]|nr:glycosyltransferase family 4 protein [Bacteroidaceae bacterium]
MRILYDHQAFDMQTHGGVSRSFVELYKHLPKDVEGKFSVLETNNVYLKELFPMLPQREYQYHEFLGGLEFRGKGYLHRLYDKLTHGGYYPNYNENYSIELLKGGNFDVFHPTFFDDYFLPYLNGKPFVLTIHDMIPELYPQFFAKDDRQIVMKRKLAPLASAIIAVSENTKNDIISILNVPEDKVHVVYHGCSLTPQSESNGPDTKPYILYVGERWGYKNFSSFIQYAIEILKCRPDLQIICTGRPFSDEELLLFSSLGISQRVHHHWVDNDEDLYALYHHALCFVYPSAYEGFGIPILEAYLAGCPVLLNNASCFPEIAGNAAVYFTMNEKGSNLSEVLEKVLAMNETQRKILINRQYEQLKRYSWEKSAEKLTIIYESVL